MRHPRKLRRHSCPSCSRSEAVFRSRPRWWEQWWLELRDLLPYRCATCCVRFYRKAVQTQGQGLQLSR